MLETDDHGLRVAVLVPCLNEAVTIGRVVAEFRERLPRALIYVYDNGSTDDTPAAARAAGAIVRREARRGKGNVVRRMFADVQADVYVMVDGDGTYDASSVAAMLSRLVEERLDMVIGARVSATQTAFRAFHGFGNRALTALVSRLFGSPLTDMLSGYRLMSRRFVKTFPALSSGFEIETELTVHALELRAPIAELATPYRDRPSESSSKLKTWSDGLRILRMVVHLLKEERPMPFFTWVSILLAVGALLTGYPVVRDFMETGLVPRLPTAVLATGLSIMAFLAFLAGVILDTVTHGRRELKRLAYLAIDSDGKAHGKSANSETREFDAERGPALRP